MNTLFLLFVFYDTIKYYADDQKKEAIILDPSVRPINNNDQLGIISVKIQ